MSLDSTSSYSDALGQYLDNLTWDGNVTKARAALEAVRFLLLMRPTQSAAADGRGMTFESLGSERERLEAFLNLYDTTYRPRVSFVQGRAKM